MTIRIRTLLIAVLSLAMGVNAFGEGHDGHGKDGHKKNGRGDAPSGDVSEQGKPGREFVPPDNFAGSSGSDWSQPGRHPPRNSSDPGRDYGLDQRVVALSDAVSMVQERFNATAVKTDTVTEAGQLVYRIRLLSADRSRVWTVSVDARTGRIN